MENIVLLFVIELFLFFVSFILSNKDILAPSVMMCSMFIISTLFALISYNNWTSVHYTLKTTIIIGTGIAVFVMSENVFSHTKMSLRLNRRIGYKEQDQKVVCDTEVWKIICLIGINLIAVMWYYSEISRIVGAYGLSAENLFASYRSIGVGLAVNTDSEIEMTNPLLNQLLKVTTASGYVAGFLLVNKRIKKEIDKQKQLGLVMIMLLSIVPGIMNAGRNPILQLIVSLMVYYYVLWHQEHGWSRNLSWKYIRLGMMLVIIGIPAFYFLLGALGRTTEKGIFEYGAIYIGSSIALFNQYIAAPVSAPKFFGEETLLGIHQLLYRLGVPVTIKNRHLEFRMLGDNLYSNIYTFFRRPLHDFGLVGMYIFTILVALFFCWFYFHKIKNKPRTKRVDYWVLVYGYIYYWIVYTSIDQRSISFISISAVVTMVIIVVVYYIMTTRFRFRLRR